MKILELERAEGKTTQALEWLREDPAHRVLVVAHEMNRRSAIERLLEAGVDPRDADRSVLLPLSVGTATRGRHVDIWVDDLDLVLRTLIGPNPVVAASVTKPSS